MQLRFRRIWFQQLGQCFQMPRWSIAWMDLLRLAFMTGGFGWQGAPLLVVVEVRRLCSWLCLIGTDHIMEFRCTFWQFENTFWFRDVFNTVSYVIHWRQLTACGRSLCSESLIWVDSAVSSRECCYSFRKANPGEFPHYYSGALAETGLSTSK